MLYKDINGSVALTQGQGTCPRFEVRRGIRLGCGFSPVLFIMVAEMWSILLKMVNGYFTQNGQWLNIQSFIITTSPLFGLIKNIW